LTLLFFEGLKMENDTQEEKFRVVVNMGIAARGILKKNLARKCRLSKPRFSEMLRGDRPFPPEVKARLLEELGIGKAWHELSTGADCSAGIRKQNHSNI
jgi:hypothetical protein